MTRRYVFADEAGCFNFSRHKSASKYFILCTVTSESHDFANPLLELRRKLAWEQNIDTVLHATEDRQAVRDAVFAFIKNYDIRIDATVLEKCKAEPGIRPTEERFYQYAWYYHFKFVAPRICDKDGQLMITVASLGTKKKRDSFKELLKDVAAQSVHPNAFYASAFWSAASDPCLQVADYCAWAIQRKWELGDLRSYDFIKDKIKSEFELFARGKKEYY